MFVVLEGVGGKHGIHAMVYHMVYLEMVFIYLKGRNFGGKKFF